MKRKGWNRNIKIIAVPCVIVVLTFAAMRCEKAEIPASAAKPPVAKVLPKELTEHGQTRIDNYYWLNQRENPEVIAYLNAENAFKEAVMAHTNDLQKKL